MWQGGHTLENLIKLKAACLQTILLQIRHTVKDSEKLLKSFFSSIKQMTATTTIVLDNDRVKASRRVHTTLCPSVLGGLKAGGGGREETFIKTLGTSIP